MAITSITPYASVSEADVILGSASPWDTASDEEKEAALVNATLYIQDNYSCGIYSTDYEQADVPQNMKEACSIVANEDLISSVFSRQNGLGTLSEKAVGAGSAKVSKKYAVNKGSVWKDPFPMVTALLRSTCRLLRGGIRAVPLVRR